MSNCCMRRPAKFHVDSAVRFWAIANIREGGGRQTPPPPVKRGLISLRLSEIIYGSLDLFAATTWPMLLDME